MIKQWATNALTALRHGDEVNGLLWIRALFDRYHDTHAPVIIDAVERGDWATAIERLEMVLAGL
jgi:hypothetical protein